MLPRFLDLLRTYDYYDKLESLLLCSLILSLNSNNNNWEAIAILLAYAFCVYVFTFTVNSITDLKEDTEAGKDRLFGFKLSTLFLVMTVSLSLSLLILFFSGASTSLFGLLALAIGAGYSLKPFRLKTTPFSLLISFLPFLLLLYFYGLSSGLDLNLTIYLGTWLTLISVGKLFRHYLMDYETDSKSKVKTIAVLIGKEKLANLPSLVKHVTYFYALLALILFQFPLSAILFFSVLVMRFRSGPYK